MSTIITKFSISFIIFIEFLLFTSSFSAQQIEANIKINQDSPQIIGIEGRFLRENQTKSNKNWAFLNSFAGVENLGERVSDLNLKDKQGENISVRKFAAGEYLADEAANVWSYQTDANLLPQNINAMAHVSWLTQEQGILMLGDLLPQFEKSDNQKISARIKFNLPKEWKIISSEKKTAENTFTVENVEKAIFLIGKNWREKEISNGKDKLNFAISGDWQFSDAEAHETASDIFARYKQLFGEIPDERIQISLVRFPKDVKFGRWEAETRGANLMVLSSDMPFKALSLQRLHEQLRHELFHLWIPNNLALTGNYDWFYEGFTVYQALRTGVEMNQIRFEDFLDTLSQAYNLDNLQTRKISLIEFSKNRWSGLGNPQVYARGMIAAFLCDIALLRTSRGKRSVSDFLKETYQKYRVPNEPQDGSTAILGALEQHKELNSIVEKYIKGFGKVDWAADLESVGIVAKEENSFTHLTIKAKPNGRQKDLLDKLGYNNWQKVLGKAK
jgi:predicted metalloprotease with PDZ domain